MRGEEPAFCLRAGEEIGIRLLPGAEIRIAAVATPATQLRESARRLCRDALRGMLARHIACPLAAVELIGEPGKPVTVTKHPEIGISISHESGLSLIAANFSGAIGVDLLRLDDLPTSAPELLALARDYLGPVVAAQLAGLPAEEQPLAFAHAWTQYEARLKCLGLGLAEWNEALEESLASCVVRPLDLPSGYVGALAVRRLA